MHKNNVLQTMRLSQVLFSIFMGNNNNKNKSSFLELIINKNQCFLSDNLKMLTEEKTKQMKKERKEEIIQILIFQKVIYTEVSMIQQAYLKG